LGEVIEPHVPGLLHSLAVDVDRHPVGIVLVDDLVARHLLNHVSAGAVPGLPR
jgi:hypothetical protein